MAAFETASIPDRAVPHMTHVEDFAVPVAALAGENRRAGTTAKRRIAVFGHASPVVGESSEGTGNVNERDELGADSPCDPSSGVAPASFACSTGTSGMFGAFRVGDFAEILSA